MGGAEAGCLRLSDTQGEGENVLSAVGKALTIAREGNLPVQENGIADFGRNYREKPLRARGADSVTRAVSPPDRPRSGLGAMRSWST